MRTRDCIQPMPPPLGHFGQNIKIAIWQINKNDCMGSSVDKRSCIITHCVTKPDVPTPEPVVDQEIVNFALAELSWGDCHRKQARVENYQVISDLADVIALFFVK